MATAKKPEENIPQSSRQSVKGSDARVMVNIFSPDHEPAQFSVKISNIVGNSTVAQRDPKQLVQAVIQGLIKKYGSSVA